MQWEMRTVPLHNRSGERVRDMREVVRAWKIPGEFRPEMIGSPKLVRVCVPDYVPA